MPSQPAGASSQKDKKEVKINKWDTSAVKNALDDMIRKVVTEKYNYVERTRLMDIRLAISAIAVGFALFALLWDWLYPFPKSRPVLIICVVSYFILMSILQLYLWFVECGTFFVGVDEDPTGAKSDAIWAFSSKLKKFDDQYHLEIHYKQGTNRGHSKLTKSIADWIDNDGNIVAHTLSHDLFKLHDSLMPEKKRQ